MACIYRYFYARASNKKSIVEYNFGKIKYVDMKNAKLNFVYKLIIESYYSNLNITSIFYAN